MELERVAGDWGEGLSRGWEAVTGGEEGTGKDNLSMMLDFPLFLLVFGVFMVRRLRFWSMRRTINFFVDKGIAVC